MDKFPHCRLYYFIGPHRPHQEGSMSTENKTQVKISFNYDIQTHKWKLFVHIWIHDDPEKPASNHTVTPSLTQHGYVLIRTIVGNRKARSPDLILKLHFSTNPPESPSSLISLQGKPQSRICILLRIPGCELMETISSTFILNSNFGMSCPYESLLPKTQMDDPVPGSALEPNAPTQTSSLWTKQRQLKRVLGEMSCAECRR